MTPGCEVCSLHVLLGGGHRRAGVVGGPQADHPHHAHPQVGLLLWLAGSGQSHRRPLGRERPRGLQGTSLSLPTHEMRMWMVAFSQIRELISRHFWSVGRSLQQERAQVITLQTKAS